VQVKLFLGVCAVVSTYACLSVRVRVCVRVCERARVRARVHACVHACVHVCMRAYVRACMRGSEAHIIEHIHQKRRRCVFPI